MKISILTLFPEMFTGPFDHSIIKRAKENGHVQIEYVNIRDFGFGKHKIVDDTAYGGGIGMVMRVDVVHAAIEHTKQSFLEQSSSTQPPTQSVILLAASGNQFNQAKAEAYAALDHLILICGHYEGIDDRVRHFIDGEISVGDFVVTGGELPAMLIVDAVTRLLPGVLKTGATQHESFSLQTEDGVVLEYPQYTRPTTYEDYTVPEVLLSGNHAHIDTWRAQEALKRTKNVRPDLLKKE